MVRHSTLTLVMLAVAAPLARAWFYSSTPEAAPSQPVEEEIPLLTEALCDQRYPGVQMELNRKCKKKSREEFGAKTAGQFAAANAKCHPDAMHKTETDNNGLFVEVQYDKNLQDCLKKTLGEAYIPPSKPGPVKKAPGKMKNDVFDGAYVYLQQAGGCIMVASLAYWCFQSAVPPTPYIIRWLLLNVVVFFATLAVWYFLKASKVLNAYAEKVSEYEGNEEL